MSGNAPTAERRIGYRSFRPKDRKGLNVILYRTGFLGEDLTGRNLFNDRRLFALVNTEAYLRYQPSNAFVAVDESDGRVVGYIIGTTDTVEQARIFKRRMYWRIALRAFLLSWWLHPESFRHVLSWSRDTADPSAPFFSDYPAHLHINILPEYQRLGIGARLIELFETRMRSQGVVGIHLGTSNRNVRAVPFYKKQGYAVILERSGSFYEGVEGHVLIVFAKRLSPS
jgi:ribosomal protein S18 acetylase RimI-like enzyme